MAPFSADLIDATDAMQTSRRDLGTTGHPRRSASSHGGDQSSPGDEETHRIGVTMDDRRVRSVDDKVTDYGGDGDD